MRETFAEPSLGCEGVIIVDRMIVAGEAREHLELLIANDMLLADKCLPDDQIVGEELRLCSMVHLASRATSEDWSVGEVEGPPASRVVAFAPECPMLWLARRVQYEKMQRRMVGAQRDL